MPTISVDGLKVIYSNSTAAADITIFGSEDDLSSTSNSDWFDVLKLSTAGTGTTIYSVDDGTVDDTTLQTQLSQSFADYNSDLLRNDSPSYVWLSDYSKMGAHIWIGTDNKIHYDASASANIQALGAGQTTMDTFDYAIRISNGTLALGHIKVNITGSNDAPVITSLPQTAAVAELTGQTGSTTGDTASGALSFTDPDLSDTHTATVLSVSASGATAGLPLTPTVQGWLTTGAITEPNGGSGSIPWSFAAQDSSFDYLAAGQAVTLTYTVQVKDSQNATSTQTVAVKITGSNDDATITGTDSVTFTEDNGGPYSANGQLQVNDPDTGESVFAAVDSSALTGTYGTFTFDSATGAWDYTLNNSGAAVQALVSGQTVTDKLTVSSLDGTATHDITMTIHGADEVAVDTQGPTGIFFNINQSGGATSTFVATGDPNSSVFHYSATFSPDATNSGNAPTVVASGATAGALTVNAGNSGILHVTAFDQDNNFKTVDFGLKVGTNPASDTIDLALTSGPNIGDGLNNDDTLIGSAGTDYLIGSNGLDKIQGNDGADWLFGGGQGDKFLYPASSDSTHSAFDSILDFSRGTDAIEFAASLGFTTIDGNLGAGTNLAAHHIG